MGSLEIKDNKCRDLRISMNLNMMKTHKHA